MKQSMTLLFWAGILSAWILRFPFGKWEFSGYDRPWMFGFALRLYKTHLFDFSARIENFFIQVLSHRGGFELFPMFAWVGLSDLVGLPLTGTNLQLFYSVLEVATMVFVFMLVRRLYDDAVALISLFLLAFLPSNLWSGLFPMPVEWILFLMVLGFLLVHVFIRGAHKVAALLAGVLFSAVTVCSRTFLVEYAIVSLVIAYILSYAWKATAAGPWTSMISTVARSPLLWLTWFPMTLGVLLQFFLFYHWNIRVGIRWGILQYLVQHGGNITTWEQSASFLRDLVLFNGVALPLLTFAGIALKLVRFHHLSSPDGFLLLSGGFYFLGSVVFQPRIDYAPLYLFPWTVLLASEIWRVCRWRPCAMAVGVAGLLVFTGAWGLQTVRDVRWWLPAAALSGTGREQFQETAFLKALSSDDYMKATGYWIRKYVPRGDVVGLYTGYWQLWTLEIYSGRSLARNKKEVGFGLMEAVASPGDLRVSPGQPTFHWAIVIHPYQGSVWAVHVSESAYAAAVDYMRGRLRYRKVGEIVENGRPVVSIYSDRHMEFSRLEAKDADQRFDQEYANLESLAFSPYVGYGMNY